jgi:hypothetical protein
MLAVDVGGCGSQVQLAIADVRPSKKIDGANVAKGEKILANELDTVV